MKNKRIISLALASLMSLGVLTACNDNQESSGSPASGNESVAETTTAAPAGISTDKPVLEVLSHRTDIIQDGSLDALTDAFEEANNCTVKYVPYTNYADDVSTRLSTDNYGDVLMVPTSVAVKDLGNFFEPLGTYDELKEKWYGSNEKMYDNTVYGIPTAMNLGGGILYNKKVFADAGITALPQTPEDFITALKAIATTSDGSVIPLYTNFAAGWTIVQWQGLVVSASGDPDFETKLLQNKTDLFEKDGPYYKVYKMMYDVFSDASLREADPTTTDWEASKLYLAEGKIGTMVLGSWAISQVKGTAEENGLDPDNIGFMPMPATVDGVQYGQIAADYAMGVSIHSSNKELAKKFVEWYCGESGLALSEMAMSALKGSELPDFMKDITTFLSNPAPDELTGKFNEIDTLSEVGTWNSDTENFKIKMAEAAFAGQGDSGFDSIISDVNSRWAAARDQILA